jgi:hypothetical protein
MNLIASERSSRKAQENAHGGRSDWIWPIGRISTATGSVATQYSRDESTPVNLAGTKARPANANREGQSAAGHPHNGDTKV